MTLQQAHKITSAMSGEDNRCPTDLQREAKETIFREALEKTVKIHLRTDEMCAKRVSRLEAACNPSKNINLCRACARMGTCTRDAKGCDKWRAIP
jgi:hypothetical protein